LLTFSFFLFLAGRSFWWCFRWIC